MGIKTNEVIEAFRFKTIMDYEKLYKEKCKEVEKLTTELDKVKFRKLPDMDDYYDDDFMEYQEALVDVLMSGDLSETELKEGFKRLADCDDWGWVAEKLWSIPQGTLWRIKNKRLEFNSSLLYPRADWISLDTVYSRSGNNVIDIGRYLNKISEEYSLKFIPDPDSEESGSESD